RQLLEQSVGLRLSQFQVLEKVEYETNFVEGQADDIDQIGDGNDDLHAEFAAAQYAGDLAVAVVWTAIDVVSDQHGATMLQPPDRTHVGPLTLALVDTVGPNHHRAFRLCDLVGRREATASAGALGLALGLAACFLPLLFGPQRKGFVDFGGWGAAELFLQFRDASLGCL